MKNLPFLTEITEARLFYGAKDLKGMSAAEIGELIYLLFMLLEVVRWTKKSEATSYASKTMELSPYDTMYYSGTDLGNLLSVLNHQDVFASHIKVNNSISLPLFQINRYLGAVRSGSNSGSDDQTFFWRLEDYLKVYSNSAFRQLRRDIGNWTNLSHSDKVRITQLLRRELDNRASQADLFLWFKQNFSLKESVTELPQQANSIVDEVIDTKLAYHETLNSELWDENDNLRPDVKETLAKIANKFSEFVDVKQLKIVDYIITGSNCNYNYTSQSDIDVHVLVDATKLGDNPLTSPFLIAKKALWNSGHDITIKGYTVELYAEDANKKEDQLVATGVYSLMQDKWLKKPTHLDININDTAVSVKAEDLMNQIDDALKIGSVEDLDRIRDRIRKMRRAGLEAAGEQSVENLAFKVLRNNNYFDKMNDFEKHKEDEELTLEQDNGIK